jgi:hypothetical protein
MSTLPYNPGFNSRFVSFSDFPAVEATAGNRFRRIGARSSELVSAADEIPRKSRIFFAGFPSFYGCPIAGVRMKIAGFLW